MCSNNGANETKAHAVTDSSSKSFSDFARQSYTQLHASVQPSMYLSDELVAGRIPCSCLSPVIFHSYPPFEATQTLAIGPC
jgi:hypothetical protein